MSYSLRKANTVDIPAIEKLIDASVRGLQAQDYTPEQIDAALRTVFTVDSQLVEDGTYFVVEQGGEIIGCGGWSGRKTLCGGDHHAVREDALLDPSQDAAKIRAIFVHPRWARRGIGSFLLKAAEEAAIAAGFTRLEMGATLTGVPVYLRRGYRVEEGMDVPLEGAVTLQVVRMAKMVS
ncbi:MAG TPA: GNAT family N-acetyltransferase [Acidobacteriaceae bacterium]|nr:GNAT family N-acetyltransferase [Acidobacteriaceae bacterium]